MWGIRWTLLIYDAILYVGVSLLFLFFPSNTLGWVRILIHTAMGLIITLVSRYLWRVYSQIWRYGSVQSYIRLLVADGCAFIVYFALQKILDATVPQFESLSMRQAACIIPVICLLSLAFRMGYRYLYKKLNRHTKFGQTIVKIINFVCRSDWTVSLGDEPINKIKIGIVGAGRVGTSLAEELINNPNASYMPMCFVDIDEEKLGREIFGLPVYEEDVETVRIFNELQVQEVVFALPASVNGEERRVLYDKYKSAGFKLKSYDYANLQSTNKGKRTLRDFDVEELLFRKELEVINDTTINYYKDKVILITGGGGSIGSELARQVCKMSPKQLVILDVYENGAYDLQQELRMLYGKQLDLEVEIISICNYAAMDRVFNKYKPNIVIMAAAHKHVPLMEHNVIEAVDNNVFGTLNTVLLSEKYGVDRVHMVSTDKAVNPTNVMGATKRICENIVMSHAKIKQKTTFSATRFGNVLGSAGSVIPLFKKQIANGGPVTITDKRIIRYFMTIPEASQLVLHSAAIAKNGDLMVLDMGQPVKIYDLAVEIIKLAGFTPDKDIEIVETGLRPGEKLYEELLIKDEKLIQTSNKLIFVERDRPLPITELDKNLDLLRMSMTRGDDDLMRETIKKVVPTYVDNEIVNGGGVKIVKTNEEKN